MYVKEFDKIMCDVIKNLHKILTDMKKGKFKIIYDDVDGTVLKNNDTKITVTTDKIYIDYGDVLIDISCNGCITIITTNYIVTFYSVPDLFKKKLIKIFENAQKLSQHI